MTRSFIRAITSGRKRAASIIGCGAKPVARAFFSPPPKTAFFDFPGFMRVVIVGAGGAGSMAAWRLAKAGQEVIALEQFRIDHDLGSSFGDSRIVRRVYADAFYTALMADAYPLWDELMAEADDRALFVKAGGIFCGAADH